MGGWHVSLTSWKIISGGANGKIDWPINRNIRDELIRESIKSRN